MKHTDGPWTAEPSVKGGYNIRDTDGNVPGVARTYGRYGAEEDEANARLIAAAPIMYDFCADVLSRMSALLNDDGSWKQPPAAWLRLMHDTAKELIETVNAETLAKTKGV